MVARRSRGEVASQVRIPAAGQAGAFLTDGLVLELDGDTNDYVGKGMEGGRIVVHNRLADRTGDRQRVLLRRARLAYANGTAGERLAVRTAAPASSSKAPAPTAAST